VKIILFGTGYGGSCLPKDVRALGRTAQEGGFEMGILGAVEAANERQKGKIFSNINQHFNGNISGMTFALWGLAFKPLTDGLWEAPSRVLLEALWEAGARSSLTAATSMALPGWPVLASITTGSGAACRSGTRQPNIVDNLDIFSGFMLVSATYGRNC
jgi:hypothetical protein